MKQKIYQRNLSISSISMLSLYDLIIVLQQVVLVMSTAIKLIQV